MMTFSVQPVDGEDDLNKHRGSLLTVQASTQSSISLLVSLENSRIIYVDNMSII